ncbi:MAG: HAMP domain-containing histidine kinase [Bacteroidia bacterium]|nr:HAMP domain-containing histidine kinase [Bacteroidia bacterium]
MASLLEVVRVGDNVSLPAFLKAYGSIPLVLKIAGPILLGLVGFTLGALSLKRYREQAAYAEKLRIHSRELEQRNQALSELNEALDSLVYTASHDLKTPVVNFKGMINMLKMVKDRPNSGEMINQIVEKLEIASDRFMVTISDLLDVSRVEKQLDQVNERLNIQTEVQTVLTNMEEQVRKSQAKIRIEATDAPGILIPRQAFQSILQNLLSNSIKYAHPDRTPEILVRSFVRDERLHITVQDNGQGIDLKENGDKLFRMFSRLHDGPGSSGVGLYIVKRTLDKAGGTVSVESEPGIGSTFQLSFPKPFIP